MLTLTLFALALCLGTIVLANAKKADLLDKERTYLNTLDLRLYTNNYDPVAGMVAGSFTELTGSPYALKNNVGFATATLNGSNQAETVAPSWTFLLPYSGTPYDIYGYYFTDPADSHKPVFAEVRKVSGTITPFHVDAAGMTFTVVPKKVQDTL